MWRVCGCTPCVDKRNGREGSLPMVRRHVRDEEVEDKRPAVHADRHVERKSHTENVLLTKGHTPLYAAVYIHIYIYM